MEKLKKFWKQLDKKKLIICIAIPLLVGGIAGFLTRNSMEVFKSLDKPPLAPPGWLFPVAWTILYLLMGISSYIIATADVSTEKSTNALKIYYYQLIVNFLWPIFFFNFEWYLFSFLWLVLLWILVALMIKKFFEISKPAAFINIPYLIWLTFAAYLNFGIWWLN